MRPHVPIVRVLGGINDVCSNHHVDVSELVRKIGPPNLTARQGIELSTLDTRLDYTGLDMDSTRLDWAYDWTRLGGLYKTKLDYRLD